MATAICIDGGFFKKRYRYLNGKATPEIVANDLYSMALRHLKIKGNDERRPLYRIFYYDCPPLDINGQNPVTKRNINWSTTETARWQVDFLEHLKRKRKVAVRLGYLNTDTANWSISGRTLKALLSQSLRIEELKESDVRYDAKQKGVDIRIGLDIASMAFKRQVDQIVLVSGDSDFVPAAKLAHREGIDFVLDPMWANIRDDLNEHIDGLRSVIPRNGQTPSTTNEDVGED